MLRAIASTASGLVVATIALAAADIPVRYSGSFPSVGSVTNVRGTFAGQSLVLKYTVVRPTRAIPTIAKYSCVSTSSNKTRCDGSFKTDDGRFSGPAGVLIAWQSGKPVWTHFDKAPKR